MEYTKRKMKQSKELGITKKDYLMILDKASHPISETESDSKKSGT
jgi:hypothetical protein